MEPIRIDDTTWRIEDGFVRFFLLTGERSAALIDSGVSSPEAMKLAKSLTSLPLQLINTHGDGDHVAGNGEFESYSMMPEDFTGCRMAGRFPNSRCIPLHDGQEIDLGGRILRIIAIPGHTAGSAAILDTQKRVLYSGDSVQSGQIFMFGAHRKPEAFSGSLEKLIDMAAEYDFVRPSHDAPELPGNYARLVLDDWQALCRGELTAQRTEIHGNTVDSYRGKSCGFFCAP